MEIFRKLNKKEYKHYYSGTIEELDTMDKNNPDLHSEIIQVVMWLYEKHGIWIVVEYSENVKWCGKIVKLPKAFIEELHNNFTSPTEAYQEAINYTLKNLIK